MNQTTHSHTRQLVLAALFLALGLALPFLTGSIPQIGSMLCPMHLPVLLGGFVLGGPWGLAIGAATPLLRSVLFGMPPLYPTALAMAFELATYGFAAGALYRRARRHSLGMIYAVLLAAMLAGRVVWGAVMFCLMGLSGSSFTFSAFMSGAVLGAVPGILLQLVLIPLVLGGLQRAKWRDCPRRNLTRRKTARSKTPGGFWVFRSFSALGQFLVGDPGAAIGHVDDPAADEAVLLQNMLHGLVVGVGVGPQALAPLLTPGNHRVRRVGVQPCRGQPVNGAVGAIGQPGAVLDHRVGGVLAQNKGEHRLHLPIDGIDKQPVGLDVLFDHLPGGVVVAPLAGVAGLGHQGPGPVVNLHNPINLKTVCSAKHSSSTLFAGAFVKRHICPEWGYYTTNRPKIPVSYSKNTKNEENPGFCAPSPGQPGA